MTLTQEDLSAIKGVFAEQFESINKRFDAVEERLDRIEERLDRVEERLNRVETDVNSLKLGQIQLQKAFKKLEINIESVYTLALDNWGQIEESRKRLSLLEA